MRYVLIIKGPADDHGGLFSSLAFNDPRAADKAKEWVNGLGYIAIIVEDWAEKRS